MLVASLLGYLLAGRGLRPVEAMRRRASEISLGGGVDERLPLPAAHDEVRRLGETLNEMLDRLRGSYERERRFVADASHELRTPLSVLKTELEGTLRSPRPAIPARASHSAPALSETDQLAQLADDLLLIARSGDGGLPLRRETVDVRELLEQTSQRFSERARSDGRSIAVEAPDGLSASLDPLRMRQALGNLVDNALRHGSGTVVLSARPAAGGSALEIAVGDEGPGLSDGARPARVRALHPRRRGPYPRRRRPRAGDRQRDSRGARRPSGARRPGRRAVVAAGQRRLRIPARIVPVRMRCGWSPTSMRATSRALRHEITDTRSSPATETKQ